MPKGVLGNGGAFITFRDSDDAQDGVRRRLTAAQKVILPETVTLF